MELYLDGWVRFKLMKMIPVNDRNAFDNENNVITGKMAANKRKQATGRG